MQSSTSYEWRLLRGVSADILHQLAVGSSQVKSRESTNIVALQHTAITSRFTPGLFFIWVFCRRCNNAGG